MTSEYEIWDKKLQDPSATPMPLPLGLLKAITCDFSTEQEIGRGGYGVVYKGTLSSGKIIAVKKLLNLHTLGDEKFQKEANSLMGIKHQNVVQFLGYCAESSFQLEVPEGSKKYVWAEIPTRLLCFEHVCNKSLDQYISDESCGLDWSMRYEIIRGICGGLHYLHKECCIVHLDLKPENILMDATMVPKIADFGLSRIFANNQSHDTENRLGTLGYMAPEYMFQGRVSIKADIYSLGVIIIEILTGYRDYPLKQDNSPESVTSFLQFKEKTIELWRNRLMKSQIDTVLLEQVRVCIELGIQCIAHHRNERPVTKHMIDRLDDVNIMDRSIKSGVGSTSAVVQAREASATMKKGDTRSEIKVQPPSIADEGEPSTARVTRLDEANKHHVLERMLCDESVEPACGEEELLEDITNNLSSDHEIARSPSGVFYKLPLTRMGPAGSEDGADRDIDVAMTPERLQSVTIRTGGVIDAFSFSYFDQSGEKRIVGPWGAGGPIHATTMTIVLGPSEVVKGILGTMGKIEHTETAPTVITSLRIVTNIQTYGPIGDPIYYGANNNTPFSIVAPKNKSIVGFFGRSSRYVNAIGAYTDEPNKYHIRERMLCHESVEPSCLQFSGVFYKLPLTRMGPVGSEDGADRDIDVAMTPKRLQSVTIRTGGVIDAFSFSYFDQSGEQRTIGPWGAGGPIHATTTTIVFGISEVVIGILGTVGKIEHTETAPTVITSLRIVTNIQTYGPIGDPIYYGANNNTPFSIVAPKNKSIVGFFGRSSRYVNAIGAYTIKISLMQ